MDGQSQRWGEHRELGGVLLLLPLPPAIHQQYPRQLFAVCARMLPLPLLLLMLVVPKKRWFHHLLSPWPWLVISGSWPSAEHPVSGVLLFHHQSRIPLAHLFVG